MTYLIEIAHGDAKIEGKGIYTYETEQEAIANFHSKLGVAMKSALYSSDVLLVIDAAGDTIMKECYIASEFLKKYASVEEPIELTEEQ